MDEDSGRGISYDASAATAAAADVVSDVDESKGEDVRSEASSDSRRFVRNYSSFCRAV